MIYKRGKTWWYKFIWTVKAPDGTSESILVRRSAKTGNQRRAKEMQEEHRRALRLGHIHPLDAWPKIPPPQAPTLQAFSIQFLENASLHVKPGSLRYYQVHVARLLSSRELATASVGKLNGEIIGRYVREQLAAGLSPTTINGDLRTLRRMLRLAFEWEVIPRSPVVHELPAPKGRERVITFAEETKYLSAATSLLRMLTILAVDTGLRPNSELFGLEWQYVDLEPTKTLPHGGIRVKSGKTDHAVRVVPLTARACQVLFQQRDRKLHERWVFRSVGNTGHIVTIQQAHRKAVQKSGLDWFPFYCWRHTFGTRCAESGMDRFTLAKLMGHSSPRVAERYYIHVTEPHVAIGFEKFLAYQVASLARTNESVEPRVPKGQGVTT